MHIRSGDRSPPLELVEQAVSGPDRDVVEVVTKVLSELRPAAVVDNALAIVAESRRTCHGSVATSTCCAQRRSSPGWP